LPLLLVPAALAAGSLAPEHHLLVFALAALAVVPLAVHIGRATEALANAIGGGLGGLLNATFGNAAELIIGFFALRAGLTSLVKASLTGSIISNVLLVLGASAVAGGLNRRSQRFNRTAAGIGTTMLLLSATGLAVPAVFHHVAPYASGPERGLDASISVVLLFTYAASLVFMLVTHRDLYTGNLSPRKPGSHAADTWRWGAVLAASTVAVAAVSEVLVGAVEATARDLGMTEVFVGVVIVALVGNAAEHYSAITMARRDQMDATLAIAVGSSTQIALFVAPVLVLSSFLIAPAPLDLLFTPFELTAIGIAVISVAFIAHDGETNWMEGVQLLAVYAILVLGFYFLPAGIS
jgi:Ca2+:H+ antiporter